MLTATTEKQTDGQINCKGALPLKWLPKNIIIHPKFKGSISKFIPLFSYPKLQLNRCVKVTNFML